MNYLIVGATGYIGKWLYNELGRTDRVIGTCRNDKISIKNMIHLDLADNNIGFPIDPFSNESEKTAVLCAGVSSIANCHNSADYAYRINVKNTQIIISRLVELGYYVVFLSTDSVFDGSKGNYTEDDVANPVNDYGRMKREVENWLEERYPETAVLRLCKVVGNTNNAKDLFEEWKNATLNKKTIKCVRGNCLTPIHIGDVSRNIRVLSDKRLAGLYHLGGPVKYRRIDLCVKFLNYIGAITNIEECSVSDLELEDGWPLDTSLISDKLIAAGGENTCVEELFDKYR